MKTEDKIEIINNKLKPQHIDVYRKTVNETLVYNEEFVGWLLHSAFGFKTEGKKYICCAVTNMIRKNVVAETSRVASLIRANGDIAVNPVDIVLEDMDWDSAMRLCVAELMKCDELIRFDNWYLSKGAKIEVELAQKLGIKITNLEDYENRYKR